MASGQVDCSVMNLQCIKNRTLLVYILSNINLVTPKINIENDIVSTLAAHKIHSKEKERQNISLNPPPILI